MSVPRSICIVFLFTFTLLFSVSSLSQQTEVTIASSALGEERVLSVSLPPGYAAGERNYPVLYVLDGGAHIQHANAATEFLSRYNVIPQLIVVAVYNVDRIRDFFPTHDETLPTSGGAGKFLDFVGNELIPYIDGHYRTSGYNVVMGHSAGGVFITYALLEESGLFDGYIAVSPYLQYADQHMVKEAAKKLKPAYDSAKRIYLTVGDEPDYLVPLEALYSLVKEKSSQSIAIEYVRLGAEDHSSAPYLSLFNGLRYVFSAWRLPGEAFNEGLAAIDTHYQKVSDIYGLNTNAPENLLNRLGYTYLGNEQFDEAIAVFTENTRRFPASPNVYDSLGEACETADQLELATQNYAKAYELAKAQNHANTAYYEANLERISGKKE